MEITGIILAGGKSSRMGTEKGLVKIQGVAMIQHTINLLKTFTNQIIIVANNDDYKKFGYPVYKDLITNKGPIGGIYTGLTYSKTQKNIVLSCDTPFVNSQVIKALINNAGNNNVTLAANNANSHQLIGVYNSNSIEVIKDYIDNDILKMKRINDKLEAKVVNFDQNIASFLNLNKLEDLIGLPLIVKLKCFGLIAENIGFTEEFITIPNTELNDLKTFFNNSYSFLNKLNYKIAVNQVINNFVEAINGEIEIALLPPFAGG